MTAMGHAITKAETAAEAAIAAVPDWVGLDVTYRDRTVAVMSPMHKGVDSWCFSVDVEKAPFFLKITHPELRAEIDVVASFEMAARAAAAGVGPKPLHGLQSVHAVVFEQLDDNWKTAKSDDLRRSAIMAKIVDAKKCLHASGSFAKFGASWSVFDQIRSLSLDIESDCALDRRETKWMVHAVHDIEKALEAGSFETAPCHADGLASNIMIGPADKVHLVDFDRACTTDPLYDLGILLNEAYAFEEEMLEAIEMFEGAVRPSTLARCRLYGIADDLFWALWSSRMTMVSSRRGIEFLKYAQWRLLRCRMGLLDPGFERKLRLA